MSSVARAGASSLLGKISEQFHGTNRRNDTVGLTDREVQEIGGVEGGVACGVAGLGEVVEFNNGIVTVEVGADGAGGGEGIEFCELLGDGLNHLGRVWPRDTRARGLPTRAVRLRLVSAAVSTSWAVASETGRGMCVAVIPTHALPTRAYVLFAN